MEQVSAVWAWVDAGKEHHHVAVVDEAGKVVLSRRVPNDEPALRQVITDVAALAWRARWAVDLRDGAAALLLALLAAEGREIVYVPGRMVNRMTGAYRGEGKTGAKDTRIIADQARMRSDLAPLAPGDELITELRMLTARRADLALAPHRGLSACGRQHAATAADPPPPAGARRPATGAAQQDQRQVMARRAPPPEIDARPPLSPTLSSHPPRASSGSRRPGLRLTPARRPNDTEE